MPKATPRDRIKFRMPPNKDDEGSTAMGILGEILDSVMGRKKRKKRPPLVINGRKFDLDTGEEVKE
jgi:hypothetical protein